MISELQITGMYNGVSTQPSPLRYPTQCAELINAIPDLVTGARKRNPFVSHSSSNIGTGTEGNPLIVPSFTILDSVMWNTNDGGKYIAVAYKARYEYIPTSSTYGYINIRVWDTVNDIWYTPATEADFGLKVLGTSTPDINDDYDLKLLPIGNTLYILNKNMVVAGANTHLTNPVMALNEEYFDKDLYKLKVNPEFNQDKKYAFVYIRDGANGVNYNVTVDSKVYNTGSGTTDQHLSATYPSGTNSAAVVAQFLVTSLYNSAASQGITSFFKIGLVEENIYWNGANWIDNTDGVTVVTPNATSVVVFIESIGDGLLELGVTYGDSQGAVYGISYTSTINFIEELPLLMWEGTYFKVANTTADADDYYLVFSEGRWQEFVSLTDDYIGMYKETMPTKLVFNGSSFSLEYEYWEPRRVGSEDSNPLPSFVWNKIEDMFIWQNRLGFLSNDNIILTEADNLTNFFASSSKVSSDADPIDIMIATTYTDNLKYAIPFQNDLIVTSLSSQYRISSSGGAITNTTLQSRQTTNIELYNGTRPIRNGRFLLFLEDNGGFPRATHYISGGSDSDDYLEPLTTHATGYIQDTNYIKREDNWFLTHINNTYLLTTNNVLYGLTEEVKGREKVQQAVFRWAHAGDHQTSMWLHSDGSIFGCSLTGAEENELVFISTTLDSNVEPVSQMGGYIDFKSTMITETIDDITYLKSSTGDSFNIIFYPVLGDYLKLDDYVSAIDITQTQFSSATGLQCGKSYGFTYTFNEPVIKNRLGVPTISGSTRYRSIGLTGSTVDTQIKLEYGSRETTTFIPLGRQRAQRFDAVSSFSGFCSTILSGDVRDTRVSLYDNSPYGCRFESAVFELEHFKRARQF